MAGIFDDSNSLRMLRELRDRDRLFKNAGIAKELMAHRSSVAEIQEALRVTKVLREPGVSEALRLARLTTDASRALGGSDFSAVAATQAVTAPSIARNNALTDAMTHVSNMTASTIAAARAAAPTFASTDMASAVTAKLRAAARSTSIVPATGSSALAASIADNLYPRTSPGLAVRSAMSPTAIVAVPRTRAVAANGPQTAHVDGAASIGPLIRKARKAMKLSQAEFAAHAGVGRRFLSELEGGKPSLEFDKVVACAQAAGIDLFARPRHG